MGEFLEEAILKNCSQCTKTYGRGEISIKISQLHRRVRICMLPFGSREAAVGYRVQDSYSRQCGAPATLTSGWDYSCRGHMPLIFLQDGAEGWWEVAERLIAADGRSRLQFSDLF